MAVAALLLALAPRSRALTGAAIAVLTLGVAGLLFLWSGNFQLATALACLFGLGAAYELGGRVRDLLVVPAVLAVWAVPYLLGVPRAAEAAAIAAGAGVALLLASGRRGDRAGAPRTPAGRRGSTRSPSARTRADRR
jgi:hypothetical protein